MTAIWGLIINTLRETVRQSFFIALLCVAIAVLVILTFVPMTPLGNNVEMYKDAGISIILLFSLLAGLLGAGTGIAKEIDDRTALTVLSKPLGRWHFVLGKYLGVLAATAIIILVLGIVLVIMVYYRVEMEVSRTDRMYGIGTFAEGEEGFLRLRLNQAITVVPGLVLAFFQVGVLVAFTTALSTRCSSIVSVVLGLGCFIIGHLITFLEVAVRGGSTFIRFLAHIVVTVLPFLDTFNINQKLSHAVLEPFGESGSAGAQAWSEVWAYVGLAGIYALLYIGVILTVAGLLFRRRELG
ncbi:MAG: hypothetical protein QGD94_07440 [Planctomycetia bacterium]|nr:hypothetical protein [Planctomycetia bacterium]